MNNKFLYIFGFEDPLDFEANESAGTDFESAALIFITASTEAEALEWGREISERFVAHLFESPTSWKQGNYASWIDSDPETRLNDSPFRVPEVKIGEYPNFDELLRGIPKSTERSESPEK